MRSVSMGRSRDGWGGGRYGLRAGFALGRALLWTGVDRVGARGGGPSCTGGLPCLGSRAGGTRPANGWIDAGSGGSQGAQGEGKGWHPLAAGLRWIPASGENLCPARTRPASPGPRPAEESWIPGHPRRSRWPLVLGSVPRCRLPGPCSPALPVSGPFPPRGFPGRSPLSPRPAGWNPRSSGKGTDPSFPERLRDSFHGRTGESLRVPCPRQPRSRSSLPRPGSSPFAGNREEPFRRSTGRSTGILPHPPNSRHQGGRASWRWASRP